MLHRKLLNELFLHLDKQEYTILTGARQVGKTTLLKQLEIKAKENGKKTFFITFENPTVLQSINEHPEKILDYIALSSNEKIFLFIDEVQYATNPSNFLKLLYDKYAAQLKIVATGSSAFYIDKKFQDSLVGRKRLFELYTLDFEEFLTFKNKEHLVTEVKRLKENINSKSLEEQALEGLFQEFLLYGGYPAVVLEDNVKEKKKMLQELVNTYIKRDVSESGIMNDEKIFHLLQLLASQTGNLLNINKTGSTLRLSHSAIENYLYILQKCFHVHLLRPFYLNVHKELSKMPKVYFNDLGLRNVLINYFEPITTRMDKGMLIENYSYIRLRDLYGTEKINYWRTSDGKEIDFIVSKSYLKGNAYEVKYAATEFKKSKYQLFTDTYPDYELQCIAYISNKETLPLIRL